MSNGLRQHRWKILAFYIACVAIAYILVGQFGGMNSTIVKMTAFVPLAILYAILKLCFGGYHSSPKT